MLDQYIVSFVTKLFEICFFWVRTCPTYVSAYWKPLSFMRTNNLLF